MYSTMMQPSRYRSVEAHNFTARPEQRGRKSTKQGKRATDTLIDLWSTDHDAMGMFGEVVKSEIEDKYFLLMSDRSPDHSVFVYCGGYIRDAFDFHSTRRNVFVLTEVPPILRPQLCSMVFAALETGEPQCGGGRIEVRESGDPVQYRVAVAPMVSTALNQPRYICGTFSSQVSNWKTVTLN